MTTAPTVTPSPTKAKTTYVILRETASDTTDSSTVYEPVGMAITAANAEQALKKWAAGATGTPDGTYVAIASRAFKPTKVTFSQTTVVILG
jgi:hypothetical protein